MTTTLKALVESKYLEAVETSQYVSQDCKTTIDKATITNVTNANVIVSISIVASGSAAGIANRVTYLKSIAPKVTYSVAEMIPHVLESGDFVSTLAASASALVFRMSGRQFT